MGIIMKNTKFFISALLMISIISSIFMTDTFASEISIPYKTEGTAVFTVTNPISNLTVGDTGYIKIGVSNAPTDLYGYELVVTYDSSFLTYIDAENSFSGANMSVKSVQNGVVKIGFCRDDKTGVRADDLVTLKFLTKKDGSTSVKLNDAILISENMAYCEYEDLNQSASLSVKKKGSTSTGGGGGGSGGGTGGTIGVGGGSNVSTGMSPTMEPADITAEIPPIFSDLDDANWATDAILSLYNLKIINGYTDGSFRPNHSITRAEFLKMATVALGAEIQDEVSESVFLDIDINEWCAPYIEAAYSLGMINGYDSGEFRPDAKISREEAVTIICRGCEAIGVELRDIRLNINFADENMISDYAVGYVDKLYMAGVINGDQNGFMKPLDEMSRAETAQIIYNVIFVESIGQKESQEGLEAENQLENNEGENLTFLGTPKKNEFVKEVLLDSDDIVELDLSKEKFELDEVMSTEPTTEPTVMPTAESEPTTEPTIEPTPTFSTDIVFECESLNELYSYNNIYAYLIPDDGSRNAFYDDFTTFQRPVPGDANIVFEIPYAKEVEMVTYFFAGEELVDFTFYTSIDGENWIEVSFEASYLVADGKWTEATYKLSEFSDTKYIKIDFPDTVNWWTPLVAKVMASYDKSYPKDVKIDGETTLIIPIYDYTEYEYEAYLVDQIGEKFDGDVKLSIKNSDIENLAISNDGKVKIESNFKNGASFTIEAKSEELSLSSEIDVVLISALIGDINYDGVVDGLDTSMILTYFDKTSSDISWKSYREADINQDGIINIIDIAFVARKAAEKEVSV